MANNIRLLFINTLYYPHISGGSEIVMQCQIEALKSRGYDVTVLATGPDKGINKEEINEVKVYRVGLRNFYWHFKPKPGALVRTLWHLVDKYNWGMRKYVAHVLKKVKPDVVICHNLNGWSVSAWDEIAKNNIPIVQVLHDFYLYCATVTMFKDDKVCQNQCVSCRFLRKEHAIISSKVNAVVGVSKFILDKFIHFGYFKNSLKFVVHNARNIDEIPQKEPYHSGHVLRLGYIGILSDAKGLKWLIEQFESVDINDITLTIAGTGSEDYEFELRKTIADSKKIKLIGYTKPNDFFKYIDVNIIPSLWPENFPGVAYEACAYNVPVIASNIGGIPEIIEDGKNGLLCDPNDRNSLGNAIKRLYNNPQLVNQLSQRARQSVENLLSINRMTGDFEKIIQTMLNKN